MTTSLDYHRHRQPTHNAAKHTAIKQQTILSVVVVTFAVNVSRNLLVAKRFTKLAGQTLPLVKVRHISE